MSVSHCQPPSALDGLIWLTGAFWYFNPLTQEIENFALLKCDPWWKRSRGGGPQPVCQFVLIIWALLGNAIVIVWKQSLCS